MNADANNLALIYSRLADFESRESPTDILQTITQKYSLQRVDVAELAVIEETFNKACTDPMMVESIKALFDQEHRIKDEVAKSLPAKAKQYHTQKLSSDQMSSDMFRFSEVLKALRPQVQDMSELCRSLQALDKEKSDHHGKMLQAERDKTLSIEKECGASLSSVTAKIDAEEADINTKAQENEELRAKLEQFKGHLELRREKLRNEEKTKELMAKLEAAKLAQKTFLEEQEQMKRDSCKSKILHTSETILQLEQQLSMYDRKFQEFESTLTRTHAIMQQLQEREASLLSAVNNLRLQQGEFKGRSKRAEESLATLLEDRQRAEGELAELKGAVQRSESKCRKLQARRKELIGTSSGSGSGSSAPVAQQQQQQQLQAPQPLQMKPLAAPGAVGVGSAPAEEGLVGDGSPISSP